MKLEEKAKLAEKYADFIFDSMDHDDLYEFVTEHLYDRLMEMPDEDFMGDIKFDAPHLLEAA